MYRMGQFLRCKNAFFPPHTCWNEVQVPIALLNSLTVDWLLTLFAAQPAFRRVVAEAAFGELRRESQEQSHACEDLDARITDLKKARSNYLEGVGLGKNIPSLVERLEKVEADLKDLCEQRERAVNSHDPESYASVEQLEAEIEPVLRKLIDSSLDLADLFRKCFTEVIVITGSEVGSSQPRPRVKLTLNLGAWMERDGEQTDVASTVVDVFKHPLHIRVLADVERLRAEEPTIAIIEMSRRLGVATTTVKHAVRLIDLMRAKGVTDWFDAWEKPPPNPSRWRRGTHPRRPRKSRQTNAEEKPTAKSAPNSVSSTLTPPS